MKLSILICSINERKDFLTRLLSILNKQKNKDVEILINTDNKEKSIGIKRNELLLKAKGDYVCFIDDDDTVSESYVTDILSAIDNNKPDVIGFNLNYYIDGVLNGIAFHSLKYKNWSQEINNDNLLMNYYRNPNHLNPVKRDISLKVMFPNLNHKEDYDYSMRLLPLLSTETYINKTIYNYLFIPKK